MNRLAAVVALWQVLTSGLAGAAGGDGLQRVRSRGTLRWAGDIQGGEPYVYQDPRDGSRVIGLGMNYAAYEAEIYRAGLQAVPIGQSEAAAALGMSRRLALRRIVLPQALRVALSGIANDFIALLKDSSLVSVITVVELTKQMTITAVGLRSWLAPGLMCAMLYLALSYPLSRLARRLERRLAPAPV